MLGPLWDDFIATTAGWSVTGIFLRLLLAMIVGIIIGANREFKGKGAGIKTHVLVAIGAALAMIVSQYIKETMPGASIDMARIAAGVVGGIGFLGVGTIIVTGKNEVRGLTTAAGLWVDGCIGLAAGIGDVPTTLLSLLFVLFTFMVLSACDKLTHQFTRNFDLYIEFDTRSGIKDLLKKLHQWDCSYSNFQIIGGETGGKYLAATVCVTLPNMGRKDSFIDAVQMLPYVSFVDEI